MENVFDLAVIGAGASGLTAAAVAAENGLSVLLLAQLRRKNVFGG